MALDAPVEVMASALRYLGEDPDSKDPAVLEKGAALLEQVRPYIRKFHSSEYINALANGDICLALGWSGDAGIAKTRAEEANNGVHIELRDPEGGRAALVRHDGDAGRRAQPGQRLRLPQLSARARGDGEDLQLRHLPQCGAGLLRR